MYAFRVVASTLDILMMFAIAVTARRMETTVQRVVFITMLATYALSVVGMWG